MVTFTYGSSSITLRNPELDNSDKMQWDRIQRRNRGGDLVVARDAAWPKFHAFTIQFKGLSVFKIDLLCQFLRLTLGKQVTYTDYEGRNWAGIITTPQADIIQEFRGECGYGAKLDFEGNPA